VHEQALVQARETHTRAQATRAEALQRTGALQQLQHARRQELGRKHPVPAEHIPQIARSCELQAVGALVHAPLRLGRDAHEAIVAGLQLAAQSQQRRGLGRHH
jgi:hypothetical protein